METFQNKSFASESVTEGHPDKVADAISDLVLTKALQFGKENGTLEQTRVACETLVRRNTVIVAGEIKLVDSSASVVSVDEIHEVLDLKKSIFALIQEIGYRDRFATGFDMTDPDFQLMFMLEKQSQEINSIVGKKEDVGAGDQGLMFGFACNETPCAMPMPIYLSHFITRKLAFVRKNQETNLGPDAKSQVVVDYDSEGKPSSVKQIVISTQHFGELDNIRAWLKNHFLPQEIFPHLTELGLDLKFLKQHPDESLKLNFKGKFEIGGPSADCGLTGRKIIVDTYGGMARHGGGAFSGKDPSKVDRSAAYFLRNVAKQIVKNQWADRCELRLAYVIGEKSPMFIDGEYKNLQVSEVQVNNFLDQQLNQSLGALLKKHDLWNVDYTTSTNYGHLGREELPWEKISTP